LCLFSLLLASCLWASDNITQLDISWKVLKQTNSPISWALVQNSDLSIRYWQALTTNSLFKLKTPQLRRAAYQAAWQKFATNRNQCPTDMVSVAGEMKDPNITLFKQNHACLDSPDWNAKYLCQHFDREKLSYTTELNLPMHFCIDRFEWPNIPGEFPATMLSYETSQKICQALGKELCNEDQWTFACEGANALPYPHGYDRYTQANSSFPGHVVIGQGCQIDQFPRGRLNQNALMKNPYSARAMQELDRLWLALPAGQQSQCQSSFGVFDLTGNIEEWTQQVPGRPVNAHKAPSVLKGGYWTPVTSRCQGAELHHGPKHFYYQTGFRCCL